MPPRLAALLLVTGLIAADTAAQSRWTGPPKSHSYVAVEVLKPTFDKNAHVTGTSLLTAAVYLSGYVPLNDRIALAGELPLSHYNPTLRHAPDAAGTVIGNPYAGVELSSAQAPVYAELGIRLPLSPLDNFGAAPGAFADFGRLPAFIPKGFATQVRVNYAPTLNSSFSLRLRGGTDLVVIVDDAVEDDGDVLFNYSAQAWYTASRMALGAGVDGLMRLTGPDANLRGRTIHQFTTSLVGRLGRTRLGLLLRTPLDKEVRQVIDLTLGLSCTVSL